MNFLTFTCVLVFIIFEFSSCLSSKVQKNFDEEVLAQREIETNQILGKEEFEALKFQKPTEFISRQSCSVSSSLKREIASYQNITNRIVQAAVSGSFRGKTYNDLAYFVDQFGSRQAGTQNLENSIDFMLKKMEKDGLENVHGENVTIPHWVRGSESAEMILPRRKKLALLGLGYSVGTPPEGIRAEVIVVRNFTELQLRAHEVRGKIVVFNEKYKTYGSSVKYRGAGASEVAKLGGLAALVRSVTPFSINSPHTGMLDYEDNVTQIPSACITVEDAQMLHRFQKRGWKIEILLKMEAKNLPPVTSRNAIGEIKGKTLPQDVVVVSGHIDSWDVGDGAMDDGGGAFISVEALALLRFLNLTPRRTLRAILWTSEEMGLIGVQDYVKKHMHEMDQFKAVFESDIGTFRPLGLDFSGTFEAGCIIQEILKLFEPINATMFRADPEVGSDIGFFIQQGVPGLSLNNANSKYFYFHHSEGDTMTVENSAELDLCTAVWAASAYVLADLSVELPRKPSKI